VIFGNFVLTFSSFLKRVLISEDDEKEDDEEEKDEDEKNTKDTVNMKLFIGKNIPRAWIIFIRGIAGKCARRSKKDV
jgi:hypothetical protein